MLKTTAGKLTKLIYKFKRLEFLIKNMVAKKYDTSERIKKILRKEFPCQYCNSKGKVSIEDYDGIHKHECCTLCFGKGYILPKGSPYEY